MSAANPYDPAYTAMPMQGDLYRPRRLHIRKIDPLSAGKVLGLIQAFIGLVAGLFLSLIAVFGIVAGGGEGVAAGVITGLGAVVILPLMYGVMGFLAGVIGALIYNVVAAMAGGIELETEE
jgi:hypothetical protein